MNTNIEALNLNKDNEPKDISLDYRNHRKNFFMEWRSFLRTIEDEPSLILTIDLTDVYDEEIFESESKGAKAFLDSRPAGQKRKVTILTREDQEPFANAAMTGVEFKKVLK